MGIETWGLLSTCLGERDPVLINSWGMFDLQQTNPRSIEGPPKPPLEASTPAAENLRFSLTFLNLDISRS